MTDETKKQIDEMGYFSLLSLWRFAAVGNPMFQGDTGEYYSKVMKEKKEALEPGEAVQISKDIGWG